MKTNDTTGNFAAALAHLEAARQLEWAGFKSSARAMPRALGIDVLQRATKQARSVAGGCKRNIWSAMGWGALIALLAGYTAGQRCNRE